MEERKITNEQEAKKFISEQIITIKLQAQCRKAIVYLSGGVDSAAVALLAKEAIGNNLQAIFIDTGLMREGEPEWVLETFKEKGLSVELVDASEEFFKALEQKTDPYDKRVAIRNTFYKQVLPEISQEYGAEVLFQGTSLTDIEATTKNSAAPQHNVLEQIGEKINLILVEPLKELRKPSIREVAKALDLPESVWNRMPFPGPGLAVRIDGEVTPQKVAVIREVTKIVEAELKDLSVFQYFAVLISDNVPNHDRTKIGYTVAISCIDSVDATVTQPTQFDSGFMFHLRNKIYVKVPEVFRVCWDISTKPPAAIEWQ